MKPSFDKDTIEQGAAILLANNVPFTPLQKLCHDEFVDVANEAVEGLELHLKIFALLSEGRAKEAQDVWNAYADECNDCYQEKRRQLHEDNQGDFERGE